MDLLQLIARRLRQRMTIKELAALIQVLASTFSASLFALLLSANAEAAHSKFICS